VLGLGLVTLVLVNGIRGGEIQSVYGAYAHPVRTPHNFLYQISELLSPVSKTFRGCEILTKIPIGMGMEWV